MRSLVAKLLLPIILAGSNLDAAFTQTSNKETATWTMAELTHRPELGIPYARAVKFKLASRKHRYRIGELISLDLAVINISGRPIFLDDLLYAEFQAENGKGQEVKVIPFLQVERSVLPEMFSLVRPDELKLHTDYALVGCDSEAIKVTEAAMDPNLKPTAFFRNDLFRSWGSACVNVARPGTYSITARLSTNSVVVTNSRTPVQTAVGYIESNPLTIVVGE